MSARNKFPLWLLSGVLYGLSWPVAEGLNLSFLAWIAFVPLFLFWERNRQAPGKLLLGTYAGMLVFALISAWWLFMFPLSKALILLSILVDTGCTVLPVLIVYMVQRRIGFQRTLWLFPLLWTGWEWIYLSWEFTMGTHLSAYSQSSNSWLIQYLDITGMWGLSCWLLYMNVIGYQLYRAWSTGVLNRAGILRWGLALAGMLLLPLGYAAYAAQAWATTPNAKQISISLLPTQFSAQELLYRQDRRFVVERTLLRNDELAFAQVQYNQHPDLYLWPETGLAYDMGTGNLAELLREAVTDWDAGLLTGGTSIPAEGSPEDRRTFISGILISPDRPEPQYHHKTVLTPLQETLPYHRWLARIPGFSVPINDPAYRRRGTESQPLPLLTRRGETFALGVSLCFEQWYPQHWARLARNGAELYCHLAAEGWYGEIGFQVFMANVSRMRAIENRRAVARCSNVGISGFYDRFGNRAPDRRMGQNSLTAALPATQKISFYSRFPNWFPLGSLLAFVLFASLLTKRYYV